jgi:choline dehydrogenase-like flavoprotein
MAVSEAMAGLKVPGVDLDDLKWEVSSTPAARNSQPYQERRVCAGNTNCIPICPIQAKYDPSVTLAEATRTGHVKVWYQCVASKVNIDADGRVSGVEYIDYSGLPFRRGTVQAKIYILAGNAIETPRLLLMSKSERAPNGVANRRDGKGVIGKNLMDHPLYLAWALAPKPVWGYRGPLSTAGIEVCRDGQFRRKRGAFRIEIGNEGWNFPIGDPDTTTIDLVNGWNISRLNERHQALFGPQLVAALNDRLARQFRLGFLVEQSPENTNTVTLSDAKDGLGLPRPRINYDLSDYTKLGMAAARVTATAIFNQMGAQEFTKPADEDDPTTFLVPKTNLRLKYYGAGHIVGTYRMGSSAADSAVNDLQQSCDHDNLFLVGSGTFPTVATANPTLTIAALCLRTADHIVRNVLN